MFTVIQVLIDSYLFVAFLNFSSHSFFHAFKCYFCVFSAPATAFSHLPIQCLILIYCIQLNLFSQRYQPFFLFRDVKYTPQVLYIGLYSLFHIWIVIYPFTPYPLRNILCFIDASRSLPYSIYAIPNIPS